MKIFYSCIRNSNATYGCYEGQTQEIITNLLTELGATNIQFIDEATYQAVIAAQG